MLRARPTTGGGRDVALRSGHPGPRRRPATLATAAAAVAATLLAGVLTGAPTAVAAPGPEQPPVPAPAMTEPTSEAPAATDPAPIDPKDDAAEAKANEADRYVPVVPSRLRTADVPVTAAAQPVPVAGRAGVPAQGVRAVVMTVTARSAAPGTVTIWPGDGPAPAIGTLAVGPDRTATTTAVVGIGLDGRVAVSSTPGPADVTMDVTGWFPSSSTVVTDSPTRLYDSRGMTVDGRDSRSGPLQAGTAVPVQIGGRGFGSSPAGSSVLLSVRSARASAPSGITVWPSGSPQPAVPSVPVSPASDTHDLVYTAVGRDGAVDMALAQGTSDVVVDLVAVVPARSAVTTVAPARLFDSRPGTVTTDGRESSAGALTAGTERRIPVGGRGGVPTSATAVVAHVTATAASAPAELRAWGAGDAPPGPSVVAGPGETRSGLVVLPLAPDGSVGMRSDGGPSDVALDVQGWIGVGQNPPRAADEVIWRSDFENGWDGWKDTPYNDQKASPPKIVSNPVRGGKSAAQFVLDGGGKRTEREPDIPNLKEGDTRFFAVSMFLAPDFPTETDEWQVLTQWKNSGTGSPPISIKVGKGKFYLDGGFAIGKSFQKDIGPAPKGRWVDLVVGMTFSRKPSKARVDAWMDGKQVVTDFHPPGGTLYGSSTSYLKTGLYRNPSIDQKGVLTMDNWRVATSYRAATS